MDLFTSCRDSISIHSLHTEGDSEADAAAYETMEFQSTPSTRRETDCPF